jgi:hypothetical protein
VRSFFLADENHDLAALDALDAAVETSGLDRPLEHELGQAAANRR